MNTPPPDATAGLLALAASGQMNIAQLLQAAEVLEANHDAPSAVTLYRNWIAHGDASFRHLALFNLGSVLQKLGARDDAVEAYRQCIALTDTLPQAAINLGLLYEQQGQIEQALAQWSRVAEQERSEESRAMQVLAFNHIGRVQEIQRRYEEAELALERSLALDPVQTGVLQHWIHIRQKACKWPIYRDLPRVSRHQMMMATSPLAMLAWSDDPVQQLLTAQAFVARTYDFPKQVRYSGPVHAHERIRIGYVSGDLCVHAVGLLLAEWFEQHDRSRFEIYAYDFSREDGSALRQRLQKGFDHWRAIGGASDEQVAAQVRADEIDVLIDMHGLSAGARPGIFASRPARLQGTYLGFIGTTAMPWLDFVIADRFVLPDDLAVYFTERPLHIDGSFIPLPPVDPTPVQLRRADLGLADDAFVMAAFGNVYKINEAMLDTWFTLLRELPSATLWLMDDNAATTAHLRARVAQAGLAAERVVFSARAVPQEFQARLALADVFLDNFPYNCGSTTRDVLQAGVPLVTLCGKTMVSRMGGSILNALGLHELITHSPAEYAQCVIALAQTPARRTLVRQRLQDALAAYQGKSVLRMRSLELGLLNLLQDTAA